MTAHVFGPRVRIRRFVMARRPVKDALNACKLMDWQDEISLNVLSMAYAEVGDFNSAVRYAEQALTIKEISPVSSKKIQRHLALFRQHQPIRSSW